MIFSLNTITVIGLIIGVMTIIKGNRRHGIIQTLLNLILFLYSILFCLGKHYFNYSGSNDEYLLSKVLSGTSFDTWVLFTIFVSLISMTFINLFDLIHVKDRYKEKLLKRLKMII